MCQCQCQEPKSSGLMENQGVIADRAHYTDPRCICPRKRKDHDESESNHCKHTKSDTKSDTFEDNMAVDTVMGLYMVPCQTKVEVVVDNAFNNWGERFQDHEKSFKIEVKNNKDRKTMQIANKIADLQKEIADVEQKLEDKAGHPLSKVDKLKDEKLNRLMRKQEKLKKKQKKDKERRMTPKSIESLRMTAEANMEKLRVAAGRPSSLEDMTAWEKDAEKRDLTEQLELVEEELGGLVATMENRQALADLYLRLRYLKRNTRKPSGSGAVLAEIPENEIAEQTVELVTFPKRRSSVDSFDDEEEEEEEEAEEDDSGEEKENEEVEWHTMTEAELKAALRGLKEQRRTLGRGIKDFKQKVQETTGRKMTRDDKEPIKMSCAMYKKIKYRMRLIDALLSRFSVVNSNMY